MIGGGLAGLSSGVALAEAGFRVRLLEKRPHLGGRATSYVLPNGEHVDNCQHVTFGCCTNLEDFYRRAGVGSSIRFFDHLLLVDPQGRRGKFRAGPLPAPFHLVGSFLTFAPLAMQDKISIARAMFSILRSQGHPPELDEPGRVSMLDWLRAKKQTSGAINRFWRVVLVSALSEELDRIDARYGVDVFWKTVLSNRTGYRMGVPTVPLRELYEGCQRAIERRGGEVNLRAGVRGMRFAEGRVAGVELEGGELALADLYIVAVPHNVLPALLPPAVVEQTPAFANVRHLRASPITGVHLWFDRPVMAEPFLTLLDHTTQWIFNKSLLYSDPAATLGKNGAATKGEQYLQLVISASYDLLRKTRQEIIELCRQELNEVLPAARAAQLIKATVIKETAATFSPEPGCDRWRPDQASPIANLFLAGDWTSTGWPATMEGAVRSGYLAAEAILAVEGRPLKLIKPDLPIGPVSRWLSKNGRIRSS